MIKTIIFDFDSTITTIEGVDELARMNGVYEMVQQLTHQAMDGGVPFEDVFYKRLEIIKPTPKNINTLIEKYARNLTPGIEDTIHRLRKMGKRVLIVTGGYKQAVLPIAKKLGINPADVWALELAPDKNGYLTRIQPDHLEPTQTGKRDLIPLLNLERKILFVGDGATDILTRDVVDIFVGFGGVVEREVVKTQADHYINSFPFLLDIINSEES